MSSQYPILENRPIDQWKVAELKEELKRRSLTVRGLKDDLINRLDDALCAEREDAMKDVDNGLHCDPQDVDDVDTKDAETVSDVSETDREVVDLSGTTNELMDLGSTKDEAVDGIKVQVDINYGETAFDQGKVQEEQITVRIDSARVDENLEAQRLGEDSKPQLEDENSMAQAEDEDSKSQLEDENSKAQLEDENSKAQLDNEDSKPPREDSMLKSSALNNKVFEVSPNLGFQVKSDFISTDSVSINETIELKDNIIVDNVKLEIDVVKPKMVEPSSSEVVPVGGESHPMDVEEPHENKVYVEEKGDNNVTNAEMNKKNDTAVVGYSEKLNLDRSSGDDSMEEDVLETKQIDSKYNPDEGGDRSEKSEMNVEESTVDVRRHGFAADKKDVQVENKSPLAVPDEKRKLHDQEATETNEPVKRQRRWRSESLKVPERQSPNITPTTTPKDTFQSPTLKCNFSISDSSNGEVAPKERVVPPSSKPPTNSLKIDCFLRPFTLKAVQELLGKTGTVTSFWMDHIKTHCYVTYSSVEEAADTRNAVYNLQWPPNGGCLLVAEFVDPQEVKIKAESPQTPTTPVTPVSTGRTIPAAPPKWQPQPSPRQASRQQLPPPPTLPPPPPLSNQPPVKEWLPPPPPLPEKVDPPIVTLDDLFRKTKATPRIYYLPLSEEQVASKLLPQDRNTKE